MGPKTAREYAKWVLTGDDIGTYTGPLQGLHERIVDALRRYADQRLQGGRRVVTEVTYPAEE